MTITKCVCGAITVATDDFTNSMRPDTFEREFPNLPMPREATMYGCNHCVNHWGIDLCGCGSGEKLGQCDGDFHECRHNVPSQRKGQTREFVGWRF